VVVVDGSQTLNGGKLGVPATAASPEDKGQDGKDEQDACHGDASCGRRTQAPQDWK